ncbi:MAG: 3-dehydroquinate dehydratase [Acidobacteriota bacterium]|nr:3-dehydroquinate dehydratase [Acidobacteriota bacterium]
MSRRLVEVLHGVNFDVLELREGAVYGGFSLAELEREISGFARPLGIELRFLQSNSEQAIVERLHEIARLARGGAPSGDAPAPAGLVLNMGAWTHYAWAIHDALAIVGLPAVEVHLSDIFAREEWRRVSVVADLCLATFAGHGVDGYRMALERLAEGWGRAA